MPEISRFYGIIIRINWRDHNPPHFHAEYGSHEAIIDIRTVSVLAGGLPHRALGLVTEWASQHQSELLEAWHLAHSLQHPKPIPPLP